MSTHQRFPCLLYVSFALLVASAHGQQLDILLAQGSGAVDVLTRLQGLGHTVVVQDALTWGATFDYSAHDIVVFPLSAADPGDIPNLVSAVDAGVVGERWVPRRLGLAYSAAIEYAADTFLTLFFESYYRGDGPRAFHPDPQVQELAERSGIAALYLWHGAEEIGHRHVAFDVMRSQGAGYPTRVLGLLMFGLQAVLRTLPALWSVRREHLTEARTALPREPLWRNIINLARKVPRYSAFLRPSFHPSHRECPYLEELDADVDRIVAARR